MLMVTALELQELDLQVMVTTPAAAPPACTGRTPLPLT
jgi:hypothetical protein